MAKVSKNRKEALAKFDKSKAYSLTEAVDIVKQITYTKFDASVDINVRLGVDPRKANQMVRGSAYARLQSRARQGSHSPYSAALYPISYGVIRLFLDA